MKGFALRVAIVSALAVGVFLVVFFGFVRSNGVPPRSFGPPGMYPHARVSIPKGTGGAALATMIRYSTQWSEGLVPAGHLRGEVAIRTIPAGAPLTSGDFKLRSPIYYPRGYPKPVPASAIPVAVSYTHLTLPTNREV